MQIVYLVDSVEDRESYSIGIFTTYTKAVIFAKKYNDIHSYDARVYIYSQSLDEEDINTVKEPIDDLIEIIS